MDTGGKSSEQKIARLLGHRLDPLGGGKLRIGNIYSSTEVKNGSFIALNRHVVNRESCSVGGGTGREATGSCGKRETQEVMGSEALGTDWRDSVGRLLHRETSSLRAV